MTDQGPGAKDERHTPQDETQAWPSVVRPCAAGAPAKLILCGEHAVVYGRPALALPLAGIRARAELRVGPPGSGIRLDAPDLGRAWMLDEAPHDPLSELVVTVLQSLDAPTPDLTITLSSEIPLASGMGSGAAIATAIVRALAAWLGLMLPPAEISALVYASEQRYHGTPSGIDNTVIAFEQAIWFQRSIEPALSAAEGQRGAGVPSTMPGAARIEPVAIAAPFTLLIGDTGVRSATRLPVGAVRQRWQADPAQYDALFDAVGTLVVAARAALADGAIGALGPLLNQNQALLEQIGVSSPEIERLVAAARDAGALGAKLSGAGWGGVILALVDTTSRAAVTEALYEAGAARVLETTVAATTSGG